VSFSIPFSFSIFIAFSTPAAATPRFRLENLRSCSTRFHALAKGLGTMKSILAAILLPAGSLLFVGCESDVPPSATDQSGADKFRRGVSGQGTIVQPDRSEDPLIREQTRVGY
jgi:hypothetical protein